MKESIPLIVNNRVVIITNKQGEREKSYCNLMDRFVKIDTK